MAMNIQPMPAFEPRSDPTNTSARWTQWLDRFYTYLAAADIKEATQKRALLLYQAGPEVYEIFKTLPDTGEAKDFQKAVDALTLYFEPEKNRIYQVYLFRQATQQPTESVDEFHTRLRRLTKYCEFTDIDFEIKMQIVCNGTSTRIRKRALRDPAYSLKDILIDGRKAQTSAVQASEMEGQFHRQSINEVTTNQWKCFRCGFEFPHERRPCPALNSVCANCGTEGHFARVCRKDKKSAEKQRPPQPRARPKYTQPQDRKFPRNPQQARAVTESDTSPTLDNSSSSDENYAYTIHKDKKLTLKTTVKLNMKDVTYEHLKGNASLRRSSTKIYAYGSKAPLPLKGQFQATLESKKRYMLLMAWVAIS